MPVGHNDSRQGEEKVKLHAAFDKCLHSAMCFWKYVQTVLFLQKGFNWVTEVMWWAQRWCRGHAGHLDNLNLDHNAQLSFPICSSVVEEPFKKSNNTPMEKHK